MYISLVSSFHNITRTRLADSESHNLPETRHLWLAFAARLPLDNDIDLQLAHDGVHPLELEDQKIEGPDASGKSAVSNIVDTRSIAATLP